mmetsp:Transcript_8717/g.24143  ORF Transcript_8717/g.24143 Transcript_8717/m.24143 type:complete len:83 (+) Transcript_8717:631-879(+)
MLTVSWLTNGLWLLWLWFRCELFLLRREKAARNENGTVLPNTGCARSDNPTTRKSNNQGLLVALALCERTGLTMPLFTFGVL